MTDKQATPRTDAAAYCSDIRLGYYVVAAEFARDLERELAAKDERIAHLEALLIAMKEEAAKECELSMSGHRYTTGDAARSNCATRIRALPLPDKRAERIRDVLSAVKEHHKDYCVCRICVAFGFLEAEK